MSDGSTPPLWWPTLDEPGEPPSRWLSYQLRASAADDISIFAKIFENYHDVAK
jgi:hypothetical protein